MAAHVEEQSRGNRAAQSGKVAAIAEPLSNSPLRYILQEANGNDAEEEPPPNQIHELADRVSELAESGVAVGNEVGSNVSGNYQQEGTVKNPVGSRRFLVTAWTFFFLKFRFGF